MAPSDPRSLLEAPGPLPTRYIVGNTNGVAVRGHCGLRRGQGLRHLNPVGTLRIRSGVRRPFERDRFVGQPNGNFERAWIAPLDAVARADDSSEDNSAVETRPVEQRLEHFLREQVFEVNAGHVQPPAVEDALADPEV